MISGRPSKKGLVILELQLFFAAVLCAYISGLTVYWYSEIWLICNAVAAAALLILAFIYFPMRFHSFAYQVSDSLITVQNGVFVKKTKYMYPAAVKYISFFQSPFGRLFKVKTLVIAAAGGTAYIPYLDCHEAEKIKEKILLAGESAK